MIRYGFSRIVYEDRMAGKEERDVLAYQKIGMEVYEKDRTDVTALSVRMDFMHKNQVCSVIDVDFRNQKVHVENKTDKIIMTAFGVNQHPNWEDFQRFLESRCFPRTRCQAKEILRANGLAFYDPLLIIEKTEGRMAEDHHWIRIHDIFQKS